MERHEDGRSTILRKVCECLVTDVPHMSEEFNLNRERWEKFIWRTSVCQGRFLHSAVQTNTELRTSSDEAIKIFAAWSYNPTVKLKYNAKKKCVNFEAITVMTVKNVVFWNVTPWSINLPTLRGASCLASTLKTEAEYSSKTSVQTKTRHNPEESIHPHSSCAASAQNDAVRCIRRPFKLVKRIILCGGKYNEGKNLYILHSPTDALFIKPGKV
jgi:hypothetical protein